jgi:hypothetical protein
MADTITLTDSRERVALDLAIRIYIEEKSSISEAHNRGYWLKLYHRCHKVVQGFDPEQTE